MKFMFNIRIFFFVFPIMYILFLLTDPYNVSWGLSESMISKFMPLYLLIISGLINGIFFTREMQFYREYVLFFIVFTLCSIVAIVLTTEHYFVVLTIEDTFASRLLIIFVTIFYSIVLFSYFRNDKDRIVEYIQFIGVLVNIAILFMFTMIIFRRLGLFGLNEVNHLYHEEAFVFVISIFYTLFYVKNKPIKYILIFVSLLSLALLEKNTGYLLLLLSLAAIIFLNQKEGVGPNRVIWIIFGTCIVGFMFVIIYVLLLYYPELLPSGSPGVRLHTYNYRLQEFFESPYFGSLFHSTTQFELPLQNGGSLIVPSHSDLLDIAAAGGGLYLLIWIIFPAYKASMCFFEKRIEPYKILISLMFFSLIIVLIFNPIIQQPTIGVLYWLSVISIYLLNISKDKTDC